MPEVKDFAKRDLGGVAKVWEQMLCQDARDDLSGRVQVEKETMPVIGMGENLT